MGTTPNYQGYDLEFIEGAGGARFVKVYNDTGSAVSDGAIKVLGFKVTSGGEILPVMIAAATEATPSNFVGVVQNFLMAGKDTIPNGEWGYLQLRGKCSAMVYGNASLAAGAQLEVTNTNPTYLVYAGVLTGLVLEEECVAIALEAYTTTSAALKNIWLVGKQSTIKAS